MLVVWRDMLPVNCLLIPWLWVLNLAWNLAAFNSMLSPVIGWLFEICCTSCKEMWIACWLRSGISEIQTVVESASEVMYHGAFIRNFGASYTILVLIESVDPLKKLSDRRHHQTQKLQKLQMDTAECTGNVHGINRVLSCTCKVLLRQKIHLTLADAKATGGDRWGQRRRQGKRAYRHCKIQKLSVARRTASQLSNCLSASSIEHLK